MLGEAATPISGTDRKDPRPTVSFTVISTLKTPPPRTYHGKTTATDYKESPRPSLMPGLKSRSSVASIFPQF